MKLTLVLCMYVLLWYLHRIINGLQGSVGENIIPEIHDRSGNIIMKLITTKHRLMFTQ